MSKSLKMAFWLLIAVNVIFFIVMKLGGLADGQSDPVLHPMYDEKISLLNDSQSAPIILSPVAASSVVAPVEVVAASAPPAAKSNDALCMEWGEFAETELEQANNALKKLQLGDKLSQREVDRNIGFWVYIAPLKDKTAITQKLAQLKARGVTDHFVVQEAGEWLNAISLGVFKSREAAQSFLEGLRAKGVNTAQMGKRTSKSKVKLFIINKIDYDMRARLIALQKNFNGSELKMVSCH